MKKALILFVVLVMAPLVVFAGPYTDPITSQDMDFPWWMEVFGYFIIICICLFILGGVMHIIDKIRGK